MNSRFTFKKAEHLKSGKLIRSLFEKPDFYFFEHPLRLNFLIESHEQRSLYPARVLFSVSKRNFKRAVDRNRIKRLLREVYRKNRHILEEILSSDNKSLCITLGYVGKELPNYKDLDDKLFRLFQRLRKEWPNF